MTKLRLELLPGAFAVARQGSQAEVPAWAEQGPLVSVTRTPTELSILCAQVRVPENVRAQRGFRCLRVQGPLDFADVGILAAIAEALARADVSIFVVSSYDTDYVLVPQTRLEAAIAALSAAGHSVSEVDL